ncbi:MAG: hypothetical protein SFT92_07895 [Rickettsiales bacterium]|nr:hypothetical protein [Rickettsiales bacterium]
MVELNPPSGRNDPTDDTPFEALADKKLKTAGYAYLVGDAALFASGMITGRHKEASAGLLWGLGGLACARYGNPDADKQMELLGKRLGKYLQKQGVAIPKDPTTAALTKEGGVIDSIETFLYQYPSQMLNSVFTIGGVQLVRSGLQNQKHWDAASGALITAGALAGLLIPEKKSDPENPPKGTINKAVAWLQEKPLRISAGLFAVNNVTMAMSAFNEMRTNPSQKSYLFKFLVSASYIFANAMLAQSSKDNTMEGKRDVAALKKLSDMAANVIAAQPKEIQEALMQDIASFLSAQPETKLTSAEINTMLHQTLAEKHIAVAEKPMGAWVQHVQSQHATAQPSLD